MTTTQKILDLLMSHKTIPSWDLCTRVKTANYRARISEMRDNGIEIEPVRLNGRWAYKLVTPEKLIDKMNCCLKNGARP